MTPETQRGKEVAEIGRVSGALQENLESSEAGFLRPWSASIS